VNFAARVAEAARRASDRVAIERVVANGLQSTTYAQLIDQAERWSAQFEAERATRGTRIAILGDNDASWIAAYLGALRIGAVVVPLDTAYRAEQVRKVLDASGASLLCVSTRYRASAESATLGASAALVPLEHLTSPPARGAIVDLDPQDAAVMLYTSGTTADPKGVVLTHANLDAECSSALAVVDCGERDTVLGVLPLFHALAQMANLLVPYSVGAKVVYLETINSTSLLNALQERGISMFVCVPQFFYLIHQRVMGEVAKAGAAKRVLFRAMLRTNGWLRERFGWNPGRRWFAKVHRVLGPRMRLLITGGSRFDPQIGRDLYDMGFTLLNGYGLTETSGAASVQRPNDRYTTSVGQALPGVEIRIAESGEIQIRGPIVMREYYGRPDATAEAIHDGWLHTGDLGHLDAEGRLFITGRQKEIIVLSSGKNIYPEEVESQYRQSPFVKELCVMGRANPGEPSAERLHAVVVPDEDALRRRGTVNVRELLRFELEEQSVALPPHKRVLSFDIWMTPLPRTTTGKLRRGEIQRLVAERAESATPASAERPLTEAERAWLEDAGHAAALEAVAAALRRPSVAPDANLELDLSLDSMERVELLAAMEQRAGAQVPADTRKTIFTVRQLIEAVENARGSGVQDGRTSEPHASTPLSVPRATVEGQNPRTSEPAWTSILATPADPAFIRDLDRARTVRALCFFLLFRALRLFAALFMRVRVVGDDHLPHTGPFIVTPNHQSYLDGLFVAAALPFGALRRVFFVGAAEYYESRAARWLARMSNIVPVDPDANLVAAMQISAAGLRANHVLVLFPEGERTIDGEVRAFRRGAAILSSHLGVPIVPMAVDGLYALWPRRRPFNWRALAGARVSLAFAPPTTVAPGADASGMAAVEADVRGLVRKLRDNGSRPSTS
jgi:long-chain acyl-CoA synthetase